MKNRNYAIILLLLLSNLYCNAKDIDTKKVKAKDIIEKIEKGENIVITGKDITGDLDFTTLKNAYIETALAKRIDIQSSIVFDKCEFKGKIIMSSTDEKQTQILCRFLKSVNFSECTFTDEIVCKSAVFEGVVNFTRSQFNNKISFEGCTFNNTNTFFNNCKFEAYSRFQSSVFEGNANFMQCVFTDRFSMQNAIFSKSVDFGGSKFSKRADFGRIQAKGGLYFNSVMFSDFAIFTSAYLWVRAEFMETHFLKGVDYRRVIFAGNTLFTKALFRETVNFEDSHFLIDKPELKDIDTKQMGELKLKGAVISKHDNFTFPVDNQK